MTEGGDQNAQGVKYLMIGCHTMPVTRDGASLLPVPGHERRRRSATARWLRMTINLYQKRMNQWRRVKNVKNSQSMYETWHRLVDEAQNVADKQITFVGPIKSRAVKHVLPALARMYCRLQSLGLPLYRLHSDRAKEFCSEQTSENLDHGA